jgi:ATP-dependent Clp protease ATP-binding subunit ClpA
MEPNNDLNKIIGNAFQTAIAARHEYVTAEHLTLSIITNEDVVRKLLPLEVNIEEMVSIIKYYLDNELDNIVMTESGRPRKTETIDRVFNRAITNNLFESKENLIPFDILLSLLDEEETYSCFVLNKCGVTKEKLEHVLQESNLEEVETKANELINHFCTNLTELANENKIQQIIGRKKEIQQIKKILVRKNKTNVMLVGESGVGKTTIAEGLALAFIDDYNFKKYTIFNLRFTKLLAGTAHRGDFEERFDALLKALTDYGTAIVFIDEIHNLQGLGQNTGQPGDAFDILKPMLTNNVLKIIGTTTDAEYRRFIESDNTLVRRFGKVAIKEPSLDETKEICLNLKQNYEKHYSITYSNDAVEQAILLSDRYQKSKFNPDKALDVIDAVGAKLKLDNKKIVEVHDVDEEFEKMSGINLDYVHKNTSYLEYELKKTVFGQNEAIDKVCDQVYLSQAGLKLPNKPIANFMFIGPTGCGKTETAKEIARLLNLKMLKIDMSEFREPHTVSKLIGSPPGYVGYRDGMAGNGLIVNHLGEHPNSLLLFDECEKAHPDVILILLQMMDEAKITSSTFATADLQNSVIVLTSNAGSEKFNTESIGFGSTSGGLSTSDIKKLFKPEFIARVDEVISFNHLNKESLMQIIQREIESVYDGLGSVGVEAMFNPGLAEYIYNEVKDRKDGARFVINTVKQMVSKPIAREKAKEPFQKVTSTIENGSIVFEYK